MGRKQIIHIVCGLLALLCLNSVSCSPHHPDPFTESTTVTNSTDPIEKTGLQHYQVLYNSDATHIMQNESPYHMGEGNTRLTKKMVKAAVQEAVDAGIDCYTLAPGQCWVPWWRSQYTEEHIRWYRETLGGSNYSNPYWNYIQVRQEDMVQDCIDVCRENNIGFFISFRLNDHHHVSADRDASNSDIAFDCELVMDHPEYQIGYIPSYGVTEVVLDFQHEAVVENRLNYIRELIANYDLDGMELDFTRRYCFFNVDTTTSEQRLEIMTGIVSETRKALDIKTAIDGKERHLSVRIPIWDDYYDDMGIDIAAFEEAGVTIFNFTGSYYTVQNFDLAALKAQTKKATVYCEIHYISAYDLDSAGKRIHRRATVEQLCTTALIAYEQGADGISVFNFQYYRGDRVSELDKPYTEPPWEVISYIKDEELLRSMPQHYFIGKTIWDRVKKNWELPVNMVPGASKTFSMYLVEPENGWEGNAEFSIQSITDFTDQQVMVRVNGILVDQLTIWSGKPYENAYTQLIGSSADHKSYTISVELLQAGENTVEISLVSGSPFQIFFIELSIQNT